MRENGGIKFDNNHAFLLPFRITNHAFLVLCFVMFYSPVFFLVAIRFLLWNAPRLKKKKPIQDFLQRRNSACEAQSFDYRFAKALFFSEKNTAHKKRTSIDSRAETRQINRSKHAGCTKRRPRRNKCCANRRSRKPHENIANRSDN